MAKPTGFLEHSRRDVRHRPVAQRVKDFREVDIPHAAEVLVSQAARCMDCGIPFCHGVGCPLANCIPEFNDMVYLGRWREACDILHATNNFPEITGRVCPAPCEAACTLNLDGEPALIRHIERQIADHAWQVGMIKPQTASKRTGKRVAVVGSGPAGLAAAQQLARLGHGVVVFERDNLPGGLLRYGIPDFKLDKSIIDRRLEQMRAERVEFQTSVAVGEDISVKYLCREFDAVCLAMGARTPRDLPVPGRDLEGVHFAMDYLTQQNRIIAKKAPADDGRIDAEGKAVVVIGGGDTGSDCVGTARRQGAREIRQFEILPEPPERIDPLTVWPNWPTILRTSTSHEEGCERRWSVLTKELGGVDGAVRELHGCKVEWTRSGGDWKMSEIPGSEFVVKADLVLLALGFVHVDHDRAVEDMELDSRGNLVVDANCQTTVGGVFAAGDAAMGASLVVRAIASGRDAAAAIDRWLAKR